MTGWTVSLMAMLDVTFACLPAAKEPPLGAAYAESFRPAQVSAPLRTLCCEVEASMRKGKILAAATLLVRGPGPRSGPQRKGVFRVLCPLGTTMAGRQFPNQFPATSAFRGYPPQTAGMFPRFRVSPALYV